MCVIDTTVTSKKKHKQTTIAVVKAVNTNILAV